MAESLELSVTQQTLDSTGEVVIDQTLYTIAVGYTEKQIGLITLPSIAGYVNIPLVELTTAQYLRINTNHPVSVQLNGTAIIPVTTDIIITSGITQLDIENTSGFTATITYDMRA